MKQFLIDLGLVLLLMCIIALFFDNQEVSKTMFQRSIDQFEETVSSKEISENQYITLQDSSDNHVSSLMKKMSDGCVSIIEFVATIFSDFISMILMVMVY
ncbi:MAG: hypothetical protein KHZ15_07715 [Coprobacillus cateniformis]|uniref:Uncharacterized protein n=1 Tax=Longibaculum muris TaxID=1796628 RepID=A0A4R3YIP7_9FIRM|nr:hypothetical protein [Longibaculum muris]KXU50286.1 hypothetical protein HMPREF3037_01370 [Candidatus Stoquefichus sp. KLE1796]MBS5112558.1 hypothetical protein [Coprobacillus cateniformis]MBS5369205.1 hypothetical protein [Coprobacillus cateniformis]MCR1887120.1 hypothetical protein [Longibaculum muris]MED9810842.1 hypothetical protein [Longibaculum muris]